MKEVYKYLAGAIIGALFCVFLFRSCSGKTDNKQVINVPAKTGKTDTVNYPVPIPAPQKEYVYKYIHDTIKGDTIYIHTANPLNEKYLTMYLQAKDSIEKLNLYIDAIGIHEYNIPYKDSIIDLKSYIKTQGQLLSFKTDYIVLPSETAVKQKEMAFRVLLGVEAGNTKEFDNFSAKANIIFQDKKGNAYSLSYDTERRIWIGRTFNLFTINK